MDTSDTLLWSGKVFDDEGEARLHTGIQAGGCGASGKQRSAPHAGRDGAGNLPFNAAQLADRLHGGITRSRAGSKGSATSLSPMASPADQAAEIARLRRELDRTRMERDVLKKVIGIFAEMP